MWCYSLQSYVVRGLSVASMESVFYFTTSIGFDNSNSETPLQKQLLSLHSVCCQGSSFHCSGCPGSSNAPTIIIVSRFSVFPRLITVNIKFPITTPFQKTYCLSDTQKRYYWYEVIIDFYNDRSSTSPGLLLELYLPNVRSGLFFYFDKRRKEVVPQIFVKKTLTSTEIQASLVWRSRALQTAT